MNLVKAILVLFAVSFFGVANAQFLADPAQVRGLDTVAVGGAFSNSTVEYEFEDEGDIERQIIGATISYGVLDNLDVIGQAAMISNSEVEPDGADDSIEGEGNLFGFGAKAELHRQNAVNVTAYGMFNYITENFDDEVDAGEFGDVDVEAETKLQEVHLGMAAGYEVRRTFVPYAALELVPYSSGEYESKVEGQKSDDDFERDNIVTVRAGSNIMFEKAEVRPEIALVGERSFLVSGAYVF